MTVPCRRNSLCPMRPITSSKAKPSLEYCTRPFNPITDLGNAGLRKPTSWVMKLPPTNLRPSGSLQAPSSWKATATSPVTLRSCVKVFARGADRTFFARICTKSVAAMSPDNSTWSHASDSGKDTETVPSLTRRAPCIPVIFTTLIRSGSSRTVADRSWTAVRSRPSTMWPSRTWNSPVRET